MNTKHTFLAALLALGLGACGGASSDEPTTPDHSDSASADDPDVEGNPNAMPVAETVRGPDWSPQVPSLDNPRLTVRVDGPTPVGDAVSTPTAQFETRVLVTNDGDEAAEIDRAHVSFDVWSDDGQRSPCTRQGDPGPAPLVEPGEAHELRVLAACTFPSAGEYEVRTYVTFDADAVDGSLELERYFAGRRQVTVQ